MIGTNGKDPNQPPRSNKWINSDPFQLGGLPLFQLGCFTLALFHLVLSVFTTLAKCIAGKSSTATTFLTFMF